MPPWLDVAVRKHPDRVAIEGAGQRLSYSELYALAVQRAHELEREGVRAADRVAAATADPAQVVITLHACVELRAAVVPLDLRLTEAEQVARAEGPPVEDGVVAVLYTSGTTGAPKAVPLSHGNFEASALGSAALLGLDRRERWLCPMPLAHVGGLSIPIRSAIYGTTAVLHGRYDTDAVLHELMDADRGITLVSLVPTMLARLLEAGLERPPTLRWALVGGGPIPDVLLERAADAGVPVAPTYGMTEACSQIATFGRPLPGVELRLAEPDREVLVRGPVVATSALSADGWLHTGDLGALDEHGQLTISGRTSDTIITGGENVSPLEVEDVLLAHPGVADAAVIGRPDPEWGEALVALVVRRDDAVVGADDLRAHCRRHLAAFKVPKAVELIDRLPRTPSGKLLRSQLG